MTKEKYILYFDLIDSRKVEDRKLIKQKIENFLSFIDITFKKDIYKKSSIVKGIDEFEIVLNNLNVVFNILVQLSNNIYPAKYRVVLVKGKIDIIDDEVNKLDGEVFHKIPQMVEFIKKNEFYFLSDTKNDVIDNALNVSVNSLIDNWYKWTPLQYTCFSMVRNGCEQKEIALKLKKQQQVISRTLISISWKKILWMESEINNLMRKI